MIPATRFEQMVGISKLPDDSRTRSNIGDTLLIAMVTAEACGGVMIATISHIIQLQGIATGKDTNACRCQISSALGSEAIQKQFISLTRGGSTQASYSIVTPLSNFSFRQKVNPLGANISQVSPKKMIR